MEMIEVPSESEIIYELQKSIFLKNLLEPYFTFECRPVVGVGERLTVLIYEKNHGITENARIEKLIYFMQCKLPGLIQSAEDELRSSLESYTSSKHARLLEHHQEIYMRNHKRPPLLQKAEAQWDEAGERAYGDHGIILSEYEEKIQNIET